MNHYLVSTLSILLVYEHSFVKPNTGCSMFLVSKDFGMFYHAL